MKKVGIITFHRALNYGSVMQAYALQAKIKELYPDDSVETIDYYPPNIDKIRGIFVPVKSVRNIARNLTALLYYPAFSRRKKSFDRFLDKYVKVSEAKYCAEDNMKDLDEKYDILVAGSDQIWNNNTRDFSLKYFFPDAREARLVSYAPSVGNGVFEKGKNEDVFEALNRFSHISVREQSGADKIGKFLDRNDVPVVIDPTVLVSKDKYETFASKNISHKKYIFMYSIKMQERFLNAVKEISRKTGLPVVTMFSGHSSFRVFNYGIEISKHSAPEDFPALIRDAEFVLTDSFHGTAFSVIYKKQFYAFVSEDKNVRDARIDTLLTKIGLEDRMLFFENYKKENYINDIDYSEVDVKLDEFKKQSVDYLKESIK